MATSTETYLPSYNYHHPQDKHAATPISSLTGPASSTTLSLHADKSKKRNSLSLALRRISGTSDRSTISFNLKPPRSPSASSTASAATKSSRRLSNGLLSPLFHHRKRPSTSLAKSSPALLDEEEEADYFGSYCQPPVRTSGFEGEGPEVQRAAALAPKVTDTHVFFFGWETGRERVLCQWFASPFEAPSCHSHLDGKVSGPLWFETAEHYMMYRKAVLMGDKDTAIKIVQSQTPQQARELGRQVKNFDAKKWASRCDEIVEEGNWYKFSGDEECKEVLLSTGRRRLVEASPSDRFWGVGFAIDEAEGREKEWGNNRLGRCLEGVRDRLQMMEEMC